MAYNINAAEKKISAGKINKTPAPETKETAFGRESYGSNAYDGPSSVTVGKKVTSPLADDLKQSSDDGEGVLDKVIAQGHRIGDTNWQNRVVDTDQKVPTTFGHHNPNASPATVPGTMAGSLNQGGNNSAFADEISA